MLKRCQKRGQVHTPFQTQLKKGDRSAHDAEQASEKGTGPHMIFLKSSQACEVTSDCHSVGLLLAPSEGKKDRAAFGATRDV